MRKWSKAKEILKIMPRSKKTNKKQILTAIYQPAKGYQVISKTVGLQQTTVRDIIHKC